MFAEAPPGMSPELWILSTVLAGVGSVAFWFLKAQLDSQKERDTKFSAMCVSISDTFRDISVANGVHRAELTATFKGIEARMGDHSKLMQSVATTCQGIDESQKKVTLALQTVCRVQ